MRHASFALRSFLKSLIIERLELSEKYAGEDASALVGFRKGPNASRCGRGTDHRLRLCKSIASPVRCGSRGDGSTPWQVNDPCSGPQGLALDQQKDYLPQSRHVLAALLRPLHIAPELGAAGRGPQRSDPEFLKKPRGRSRPLTLAPICGAHRLHRSGVRNSDLER